MQANENAAKAMLDDAYQVGRAVSRRAPKDFVPLYFWGAFLVLLVPGFDYFSTTEWGWTVIAVAAAGTTFTAYYYASRSRQVRTVERVGPWTWIALNAWVSLVGLGSLALGVRFQFTYTLGGLLSGVPYLLLAERLRNQV
ncbi:MAG: hypothetical protein ACT4OM_00320 [Actinomycetota bacterium]